MFPKHLSYVVLGGLLAATLPGCGDDGGRPGNDLAMQGDGGGNPDGGGDGGGGGDMTRPGPTITMCPQAGRPPLNGATCQVTAGGAARLFTADVLLPDEELKGGQVLVDGTGKIVCAACDCSTNAAAQGATTIDCPTGVLSPGLINSHDHITFQGSPGTDSGERYEQRHDWRKGLRGHKKLPTGGTASSALIRWAELRFMMGGATSTVGSGGQAGFLRNLDRNEPLQEGIAQKAVDFDTFPLGDSAGTQLSSGCAYPNINTAADIAGDDAYLPHIAEGIDAVARNEFLCVSMPGSVDDLTQPQSAFIHSVGLQPTDYSLMAREGTAIIWSPRSNVRLYGDTARVTEAARFGALIALGTDWLPSGSMNLLRELKCADSLNQTYYHKFFNDWELWRMVTINAAQATGTDDVIGQIAVDHVADLTIFDGTGAKDWRAVIDAKPESVVLVMRGGKVIYGDAPVVTALGTQNCDAIDVCGAGKSVCVMGEVGQTLPQLTAAVGTAAYPLFSCTTPTNEPSCTPARPASVNSSTIYDGTPSATDSDGDGIPDATDNCPDVFNPIRPVDDGKQADFDSDGQGDPCDPCPLDANTMVCQVAAADDQDADGVTDKLDNCPTTPNKDQLDSDGDMKGDACDACPMQANPGTAACAFTVYQIKTGAVPQKSVLAVKGIVVTGVGAGGFFAQVPTNDPAYAGAPNSGIFISQPTPAVAPGDKVDVQGTYVIDAAGQAELVGVTVTAMGTAAIPAPVTEKTAGVPLTAADLSTGATAMALDAVLVRISNVVVTDIAPAPGPGDTPPINEFVVDNALRVNDYVWPTAMDFLMPPKGEGYASLTGILDLRNGNYKIELRDAGDAVLGPPRLISIGPSGFVRTGTANTDAIPQPLLVTLSHASTAAVSVSLTSGDAALSVPASVIVPGNATSAKVPLTGNTVTAAPVTVTAMLNGVTVTAGIRVIGPNDPAALASITPATASTSALGKVTFTVGLDIPAPSGGVTINLSSAPGGTVPASVTIAQDQLTATFTYQQSGALGTDTITATDGTVTKTATVAATGHLVINEVDYDQIGSDLNEFIEIYNPTGAPANLSNLAIVFINGSGNAEYGRVPLSGTLNTDGYLVVAASTVTVDLAATKINFSKAQDNIQNGAPDGIALINTATMQIIDALSYEGSITAAVINGFTGTRNLVEGTALPIATADSNTVTGSLVRMPNGVDSDNASVDWVFTTTITPGSANVKTP